MNRTPTTRKSDPPIRLITLRGITATANIDSVIYLIRFVAIAILVTLFSVTHSQVQVDQAREGSPHLNNELMSRLMK